MFHTGQAGGCLEQPGLMQDVPAWCQGQLENFFFLTGTRVRFVSNIFPEETNILCGGSAGVPFQVNTLGWHWGGLGCVLLSPPVPSCPSSSTLAVG